ncbi:hypothetical protein EMIHUDRAFT_125390, partial [Emiliania huxleyi CCMP1516]|uniref:Cilia- and flagella-associated protein 61 N-terminal domain-containing protein n=2 Tax=Emiliania huxleyi TaxID=2903 RepID=A0A0D3HZ80_EMIH1
MSVAVRRAEFEDRLGIEALITDEDRTRFGALDVATLLETATLGITAVDERGQVVGYAALSDAPGRPEVDPAQWPEWFRGIVGEVQLGVTNSAWLALFVCHPAARAEVAENVMRTAFATLPE